MRLDKAMAIHLAESDLPEDRISLDHGLTGTNRDRSGLAQALAASAPAISSSFPSSTALPARYPTPGTSATPSPRAASSSRSAADPADPMGKMFFNILATVAEFEVDLLRMRTREGMAVARAKVKGKQPKPTARQQSHLVQQHQSGERTIADLVELFSVSRATVYRGLERHQNAATPSTPGRQ